jgi:uncharacterized phage-associated protein
MQFSEMKAAQVAAFFLHRAGGRLEILKLMKLMYLAERASYQKFGEPMIGDKLVSMDNGPALSITLNHMNRFLPSGPEGWETWVSDRNDYVLALNREVRDPKDDLLELSDAELELLDSVWTQYGGYGSFPLAELTHEICPEWEDPHGNSLPITQSRLLRSLGFDPQTAKELEERIESNRHIDLAFSRR